MANRACFSHAPSSRGPRPGTAVPSSGDDHPQVMLSLQFLQRHLVHRLSVQQGRISLSPLNPDQQRTTLQPPLRLIARPVGWQPGLYPQTSLLDL